jgi:plasmid stabilization system protein ParE
MSWVQFTAQAGRDVEEIEKFISLDNPDAAARLLLSIHENAHLSRINRKWAKATLICRRTCADFQSAIILFFIGLAPMELK